jgi:hypothetical protein
MKTILVAYDPDGQGTGDGLAAREEDYPVLSMSWSIGRPSWAAARSALSSRPSGKC